MKNTTPIAISIHGGAGTLLKASFSPEKESTYHNALKEALQIGYLLLKKGLPALDAVEEAIKSLEDCPFFNAGKGSVFTSEGKQEMDASIMCGNSLKAGAVTGVQKIKNPISLARKIMDNSEFVFLSGKGAEHFAKEQELTMKNKAYFFPQERFDQWLKIKGTSHTQMDHNDKDKKFGTVGAVALDSHGNLAAATSTGGMTNKAYGRIGDSPLIGAGNYANNRTCAISCTGHGEYFIRGMVAYDVSCLMEYKGLSLKEACQMVIHDKLPALGGTGGLIALDIQGNIAMPFNTSGMYRGMMHSKDERVVTEIF
jgi:L-asparaginase / beta-aspartyl-peptidase